MLVLLLKLMLLLLVLVVLVLLLHHYLFIDLLLVLVLVLLTKGTVCPIIGTHAAVLVYVVTLNRFKKVLTVFWICPDRGPGNRFAT